MAAFLQAMGAHLSTLPPAVQRFHSAGNRQYSGIATITRSRSFFGALMLKLAGFPPAGQNVSTTVSVVCTETSETWTRDFGGHITRSTIRYLGQPGQIEERLGPLRLVMALTATEKGLHYAIISVSLFGWLKAPAFMCPVSDTWETQDENGDFYFDVAATAPLAGQLIRYHGALTPSKTP